MTPDILLYFASAVAVGLVIGFVFGRRSARDTRRIRELEAHLESLEKDREHTRAELAATRDAFEAYRGSVAEHFSGTSDLLRDLTERYRRVYTHLAAGAQSLCPQDFAGLAKGFAAETLAAGEDPAEEAPAPERAAGTAEPKD
jgi:uncharacterized protein